MTQRLHALMGAVLTAAVVAITPVATAAAQAPAAQSAPGQAKKYRATSPIVKDPVTGQRRMPTEQEVVSLVATLETLTARNTDVAVQAGAGGVMSARVDGFEGVILARATESGTLETQCVFSFAEGVSFLGLEPVIE